MGFYECPGSVGHDFISLSLSSLSHTPRWIGVYGVGTEDKGESIGDRLDSPGYPGDEDTPP